jgi:hypothetical protein
MTRPTRDQPAPHGDENPPAPPPVTGPTWKQLKAEARRLGIPDRTKMGRAELERAVAEAR